MKKFKILVISFMAIAILASCGKDDDTTTPPDNGGGDTKPDKDTTMWVAQVKQMYDGEYKPVLELTYDTLNRLAVATEKDYNFNTDTYYLGSIYKYEYVRGTDGKVSTIKISTQEFDYDAGEWLDTKEFMVNVQYTGNNITQVSSSGDGEFTCTYTWVNGKITKIVELDGDDDNEQYTYTYSNGNCVAQEELPYTYTHNDRVTEGATKATFDEYFTDKTNWQSHIPAEYLIIKIIDSEAHCMSNNQIKKYTNIETNTAKNATTNAKIEENVYTTAANFSYQYNTKGMVSSYTQTNNYTWTYTNFENPENNDSETYDPKVLSFEISYNR